MLVLYNSLTQKKMPFRPARKGRAGVYTCGPTVYQYAHLGNLRTYLFADTMKRALLLNNFRVTHVMNITDVGHLASDTDTGEDKVEREARRQHRSAWEIARFYEDAFKRDLERLRILPPDRYARATEHIKEQITLIRRLENKGFTYRTSDGIYFDTAKFPAYGAFKQVRLSDIKPGARIAQKDKRNPTDFALWKFSPEHRTRQMEWLSPWGKGFPGWHIECSAMSMKYLGAHFDIHTGGIDHIPIHHTNEIAQSEAATGKPLASYWLHGNFLRIESSRMGKSEGNMQTLDALVADGFAPLDFRYLALTAHYRTPLAYSRRALAAAQKSRLRLARRIQRLPVSKKQKNPATASLKRDFLRALNDDLNTPRALAVFHRFIRSLRNRTPALARQLAWFERGLGLALDVVSPPTAPPPELIRLAERREQLRAQKQWKMADKLRRDITKRGWRVEDSAIGPRLTPDTPPRQDAQRKEK